MSTRYNAIAIAIIFASCQYASAWIISVETGIRRAPTLNPFVALKSRYFTNLNAEKREGTTANDDKNFDNDVSQDGIEKKSDVEWGVSYIGGDPCGSKYNSDPFDQKPSDKPGMPYDMKARIEALAQKKIKEERDKKSQ